MKFHFKLSGSGPTAEELEKTSCMAEGSRKIKLRFMNPTSMVDEARGGSLQYYTEYCARCCVSFMDRHDGVWVLRGSFRYYHNRLATFTAWCNQKEHCAEIEIELE